MIDRVIVGIDFSEPSKMALAQGARWAKELEVPLVAMHVLQLPPLFYPEGFPAALPASDSKQMEAQALYHLTNWAEPYPFAVPKVVWGNPAEALTQEADPDSLLVIGQAGHSRLEHFFFGSTASRVVRHALCDVLVVRSEKATAA